MGSAFHQLCPRYSGTLTPTAPMAIRLWETFTFFTSASEKNQALFSSKDKSKKLKCRLLHFLFVALRVKT